jgi:hypothetical protein
MTMVIALGRLQLRPPLARRSDTTLEDELHF